MKKGFTLVEIVLVMTIISVLLTGGFFVYIRVIERSRINQALTDIRAIQQAVEQYHADLGYYPPDTDPRFDPGLINYAQRSCTAASTFPPQAGTTCPVGYDPSLATTPASYAGPYLDVPAWPLETPWGGVYDYDYWPPTTVGWQSVVGTCVGMPAGIYVSVRSHDQPWTATGTGFPPPGVEQYFRDQGHDTCAANNGVIYYLLKPLN